MTRGVQFAASTRAGSCQVKHDPSKPDQNHDDVIKWKYFPCYWPFVRGMHRSPVNSPQRPVTRSFDIFFHMCPNKQLSKQSWGWWWFETPSRSLWRHCDDGSKNQADNILNIHEGIYFYFDSNFTEACFQAHTWQYVGIHYDKGSFVLWRIRLIPVWMWNYIHDKIWDEITYSHTTLSVAPMNFGNE